MYSVNKYSIYLKEDESFIYDSKFDSPINVYSFIKDVANLSIFDRECFLVFSLDSKLNLIGYNIVSMGSLNNTVVHPREVFKFAILANSFSIILAHNHPSKDCIPSEEDKEITRILVKAGNLLNIQVLDHLIFSLSGYYSFKEEGLLNEY